MNSNRVDEIKSFVLRGNEFSFWFIQISLENLETTCIYVEPKNTVLQLKTKYNDKKNFIQLLLCLCNSWG